ncbi:hypothetical protein [Sphingobium sp. HDIP04]|uniref:hypothetical protein n=1 Tax=Sphingobium sp. HDIP04 TaxID=428994 RepID=UPI00038789EB|nr:hypothetical protein [Sphingobium sp. HDIP04]EQA97303.1 hypothetical protein L286_23550 [Sphingobium sp. HDIP04]
MIGALIFAAVTASVGFLAGCLWGGIGLVEKLAAADNEREEFKRRLNRILETDVGIATPGTLPAVIYSLARGEVA